MDNRLLVMNFLLKLTIIDGVVRLFMEYILLENIKKKHITLLVNFWEQPTKIILWLKILILRYYINKRITKMRVTTFIFFYKEA